MKSPCAFKTEGRACGLSGHRTDVICNCADKKFTVCWHFYCAFHYVRLREHLRTHDAEYEFFRQWCHAERYPICQTNPSQLWRILTGIEPASVAPRGAFLLEDPWRPVIEGRMTEEEYFAGRQPGRLVMRESLPTAAEVVSEMVPDAEPL